MADGGREQEKEQQETSGAAGVVRPGLTQPRREARPAEGSSGGRVINSSVAGVAARCNPLLAAANIINNTHQIEISLESARRWLIKI